MKLTSGPFARVLAAAALTTLLACARGEPAPQPADGPKAVELSGTPAERVTMVRELLTAPATLSGTIIDAQFREERPGVGSTGDDAVPGDSAAGVPGHSAFYELTVAPTDVGVWLQSLPPLDAPSPAALPVPSTPTKWWPQPADLSRLRFFSSGTVTSRATGWVAVDSAQGRIFIHTVTP